MPELKYQSGFGNEFATEAQPRPPRRPELPPETSPRPLHRAGQRLRLHRPARSQPPHLDVPHPPLRRPRALPAIPRPTLLRSGPFDEEPTPPNQMRWDPLPFPTQPTDFVEGLVTLGGNGSPAAHDGVGIHIYAAKASMTDRFFYNADGELLILPQQGALRFVTECGILEVEPGELAVIPRGIKFRVELLDDKARGYICENYGQPFRLPDLGPIGANGLANPRDFLTPSPPTKIAKANFKSSPNSSAGSGSRTTTTRRSTSSPGTATTRPTSTTWPASTPSTPSASTTPTPPSSPCSPRPRTLTAQPTATSPSFPRAGSSPSTPSARPGSTAT